MTIINHHLDAAARAHDPHYLAKGGDGVRRMVNDTEAIHQVK
jgi:hypothetical protein